MKNYSFLYTRALLLLFTLALSEPSFSLQIIEPIEGTNSFAKISSKDLTRIAIDGGKISHLIMSDGDLLVEKEPTLGQVYVRPTNFTKPVNIRVVSTKGKTYSLILQPVDVPQEEIILRVPTEPKVSQLSAENTYLKGIKSLISAMASEEPGDSIEVRQVNQEMALWQGTKFVLEASYSDRLFVGDRFILTNMSQQQIVLVEQELYRKGVIAVAIQNMTLEPGQSTYIYVVRSQ